MHSLTLLIIGFAAASAAASSPQPVTNDTTWFYEGCFSAPAGHILDLLTDQNLTSPSVEDCWRACIGGSRYAALGDGACYCGNELIRTLVAFQDDANCSVACAGDDSEACGGPTTASSDNLPGALSLYDQQPPVPVSYNGWSYMGCLAHMSEVANLTHTSSVGTIGVESCLGACDERGQGYTVAGLSGTECYCGTKDQLPAGDLTYAPNQYSVCNYPCPANARESCGGWYTGFDIAISLYERENGPHPVSSLDLSATGQLMTRTITSALPTGTATGSSAGKNAATATSSGSDAKKTSGVERVLGDGLLAVVVGALVVL